MTDQDRLLIEQRIGAGDIVGPVLELGAGYTGDTCKDIVRAAGLEYIGTDVQDNTEVDLVADFENSRDMQVFGNMTFRTILCLNVLEHVFSPISVLDNCLSLLDDCGTLVALTPCVWPLHRWPIDTYRLNPDLYIEYACRRGLELDDRDLVYVGYGPVSEFESGDELQYPPPGRSQVQRYWSRLVHKVADTFGRGVHCPTHLACAALMRQARVAESASHGQQISLPSYD